MLYIIPPPPCIPAAQGARGVSVQVTRTGKALTTGTWHPVSMVRLAAKMTRRRFNSAKWAQGETPKRSEKSHLIWLWKITES